MMMYQPLPGPDYLRVIKLEPGLEDDILSCKLETVSLDGSLDLYEAISYVWGDPTATEEICCNGLFVEITSGLADALRRFRYPDKQRLLWADALCINQQDNQEKSRQVKQMGRIYENAKGVLVWVGRDSQGFAEACFRLLQEMNRYLDEVFIECESKMVDMPLLTAPYPICDDPEQWIKVQELLDLPWFERVWTIQEAALAKECQLCWGAHSIDIADIFEFVIWRHYKVDFDSILVQSTHGLRTAKLLQSLLFIHAQYQNNPSWRYTRPYMSKECARYSEAGLFVHVLACGQHFKCTDPRDRIYAFLGNPLARFNQQPILDTNYDAPMDEILMHTASALIQHPREGSWLLSQVEHVSLDDLRLRKMPSWVPRWAKSLYTLNASTMFWYEAAGTGSTFSPSILEGNVLQVEGFVFDKIVWTSELIEGDEFTLTPEIRKRRVHAAGEPFIDLLYADVSHAAGVHIDYDEYTWTLVREYRDRKTGDDELLPYREYLEDYCQEARSLLKDIGDKAGRIQANKGHGLYLVEDILRTTNNQRLIRTESGRLGLAPGFVTEVGDMCCILFGATVPFILKPTKSGRYQLGGGAYVYGVMHGQLMEQYDNGEFKKESIMIE